MIQPDPGVIPDGPLFHYTSVQGLLGIITNRSIWATDIRYLNDAAEFQYTLGLARQQVSDFMKSGTAEDRQDFELMDGRLTKWIQFRSFAVFVASFSACCDELSQWRAYAPYGAGFSIGFDFSKLKDKVTNQWFRLARCIYDETEQHKKVEDALIQALQNFRKSREENVDKNASNPQSDCSQALFRTLIPLASQLKHPKFSEEQEWRLVSRSMPPSLRRATIRGVEPPRKYRVGKSMVIVRSQQFVNAF